MKWKVGVGWKDADTIFYFCSIKGEKMKICISCGKQAKSYTEFKGPNGETIVRCKHCKEVGIPYKTETGFEGP